MDRRQNYPAGGSWGRGKPAPFYFRPTTEQRYTSSVSTSVISGLAPAAAASTSAAETNWWGVK